MNAQWLEEPAVPLLRFAEQIGVPENSLRNGEALKELKCPGELIAVGRLVNLTLGRIGSLIEVYGSALKCKLLLDGHVVLDIKPEITNKELNALWGQVIGSSFVELELIVDKAKLAKHWLGPLSDWPPLLEFAKQAGIPERAVREGEGLEKLVYKFSISKIVNLILDRVVPLTKTYGGALECKLLLQGVHELEIRPDISVQVLGNFLTQTAYSPVVELQLALNKEKLVEYWLGPLSSCRPFLLFFAETLEDFLRNEPEVLRKELWGDDSACKVILFVPGRPMRLDGPYLAVLGGKAVHSWRGVLPASAPDSAAVQDTYDSSRQTLKLKWVGFQLGCLTPLHLKLGGDYPAKDTIANALFVHLINLAILYTADRTERIERTAPGDPTERSKEYQYEATYIGADQTVTFELAKPVESSAEVPHASAEWFVKAVEWTYERIENGSLLKDWSKDRLPLVQIAVCRTLRSAMESERYQWLVYSARNIFHDLEWHWRAFIEGKVDAYIARVKELEDYVDATVAGFDDNVSSMIDSLSKTMLAAIATVLGSFVGAVFKDKFNPLIFIIGMSVYAAYVSLFPLGYNMVHTWVRYRTLVRGFEQRLRRFEQYLYEDKVEEIMGRRVVKSRRRFVLWFWLTVGSYAIVIVLAILAALWVPDIIAASIQPGPDASGP